MRNISNKVALKPASARRPTDPTVFYKLAETSGATLRDSLGNGADLTLAGYASGTPFAAPGYIQFDGTNHYITSAASAAGSLETIFDLRNDFGAVLIGIDPYHDADVTAGETILSIGTNTGAGGVLTLTYNAAEIIQLSARGVGASASAAATFTGTAADLTSKNGTRCPIMVVLHDRSGLTCLADLYVDGAYVSQQTLDFGASSGNNFPYLANGLFVGVTAVETGSPSGSKFGAGGATVSRLSRLFAQRHATYDATRVAAIALGIKQYGFDLPPAVFE